MWNVEKKERAWKWILWSVAEVYEIPFSGIIQSNSEFDFIGQFQFKSFRLTVVSTRDDCGLSVSMSFRYQNQIDPKHIFPIAYIGAPNLDNWFTAMMGLYFGLSSANVRVIRKEIWKS